MAIGESLSPQMKELVGLYAAVAVPMAVALAQRKAGVRQFLRCPVWAAAVLAAGAVLWTLIRTEWIATAMHSGPSWLVWLGGIGFFVLLGYAAGVVLAGRRADPTLKRGTVIEDAGRGRYSAKRVPEGRVTVAGIPLELLDETKHFKFIGTTGTGKSTAIRELLAGALARGDRAIIADPDGSAVKRFYNPARGDLILNPFDARSARWDLFAEIHNPHDAEQLARSLIPDTDGSDKIWRAYGRTLLTALLKQLHRVGSTDMATFQRLFVSAPVEELQEVLADTAAAPFLAQGNEKFFGSVRSVANNQLEALSHVAAQKGGAALSLRQWVREGRGVLFLPYKAGEIASLRTLISCWMRLAIFETMDAEEGDQRLWFVIDELDALGPIDGLKDALARLRKFGGRCILGFQSIAQMRGTYGDTDAQVIVENCGNTLILRCSASERGGTAEFASRLIGRREVTRQHVSRSRPTRFEGGRHETQTTSEQHVTEDAVMASEIEQLPDLVGYLKIASQPAWRKVQLQMSVANATARAAGGT